MAFCARRGLRKGTFSFCKLRRAVGTGAGRRGAIGMQSAGAPAVVPIQITAPEVLGATALEALDGEVEVRPARVWGGACPGAPTDSRRRRALIG